jgi:hypothetical protein
MLLSSKGYYEVEKLLGAGVTRYNCGGGSGMPGGGARQPLAAGMAASQARVVSAALTSARASPFIQDPRKGVAFLALTPQELAAFTFLHDSHRWASPQSAPYM